MKTNVLSMAVAASLLAGYLLVGGEAPAAAPSPSVIPAPVGPGSSEEGYFLANGAVYTVKDGKAVRLNREVTMRISPAGITGFDGTPVILPAGQMIANDGHWVPLPAGVIPNDVKPIEPGATDPASLPTPSTPVEGKKAAPIGSRDADPVQRVSR